MALIINPPSTAIPVYPWMIFQDYFLGVLETVRASQVAEDASFDFTITKNRLDPIISGANQKPVVNCLIGKREDKSFTRISKVAHITFLFEFLESAFDEAGNLADEIVVEKLQYLSAMVEFGVTALYNNLPTALNGLADPVGTSVTIANPDESRKTEHLILFGNVGLEVKFQMDYADYQNLPALTDIKTAIGNNDYNFIF